MQQQREDENWANQMGSIPASDVSPNPNWGFHGAEAGYVFFFFFTR